MGKNTVGEILLPRFYTAGAEPKHEHRFSVKDDSGSALG